MYNRKKIVDMFSTFLQLEGDKFSKWLIDVRLSRNMQNCLDLSPEVSKKERFWAIYWHKQWCLESNPLAKMHMQAYLQEAFYWSSQKTVAKLANSQYGLADYFQMANMELETILKGFNPIKSSSLKSYAVMVIQSRIRDILRQRKDIDICSNWSLLRKISKKLFVEALNNAGLSEILITQHCLAWKCFKEIYVQNQLGTTQTLPEPTSQEWEAIVNLYNDSRYQLNQPTTECNAKTIEKWLKKSVLYVRTYLFPPLKSLDGFQKGNDDTNQTQTLEIPDPSSDSLIADMIAEEDMQNRQNQISQMFGVLAKALQSLDEPSQKLLKLYYYEELTQQQIMQELQISQPTVSRKLVKSREYLLEALVKWSQDLNISVNPNQLKNMSITLEEWLRNQSPNKNIKT